MTTPNSSIVGLSITLFGPMQVLVYGHPLPHLRSRKTLWLLALLTLRHGRPVAREWLAGTLWPDMDQSQAFANLRPILSNLRRALGSQGERLQSPDRHTLLLDLAGAEVDILTFDAMIGSRKLSDLERGVALYRGPLLEGCNEDWVPQESAARERNCLQTLQKLADVALAAGDNSTAIRYYQRAVSIDPWWDSARRGWMEALAKSGDTNAALQVYREFADVLKSDPKAVPDEQTSALYQRLRSEARQPTRMPAVVVTEAAVPVVQGYLPYPLSGLIGREDERDEVALRLRRSRLVTLTGMGGIGKTRLAIAVAAEVLREYADGVWLVALEVITEGKIVAQQIASVLGVRESPGRSLLQSVADRLRTKRLLLVLDNCEHLLEASAQAAAYLLQECAEVRILATSREALGITGETVWAVPALATPDLQHLPQGRATLLRVVMSYESVQLFMERAQAVQKSFALTGENAMAVARICSQLEGMPLAIELAAARVKSMTVTQIAARLQDHLSLLTGGSRTAVSRQKTLRATLDWSHELLQEPEQRLLGRLAAFVGGWRLEAAQEVCAGEGIAFWQVPDLLMSLVDKSLVVFGEAEPEADGRYRLFEVVRQYAAERLQVSDEAEEVRGRHREWCLRLAEQAEPELRTGAQQVWLRRMDSEHENLRAALNWGLTSEQWSEAGMRLAGTLWRYWDMRGQYSVGREYLHRILGQDEAQSRTAARAMALYGAGTLAYVQGDYVVAQSHFHESLGIRQELKDKRGTAEALSNLGLVAGDLGDYAAAWSLHEQSLALRRESEDRRGIADSISNLGNMALRQSDCVVAQSLYEESLSIHRELGEKVRVAAILNNLGLVAAQQSDYVRAWSLHEESLDIRRELGHQQGIAFSLNNLGTIAYTRCDYTLARSLYEESLRIRRELGDRRGTAASLNNLGSVVHYQGEHAASWACYEESLSICRELGYKSGIAVALGNMGEFRHEQGDHASACSLYEESLSIRKELGDKHGIARALEGLGNVAYGRSDYSAARALHAESLQVFRDIRDLWGVSDSLKALAAVLLAQSEPRQAACLWGAAHRVCESIGAPLRPADREKYDQQMRQARAALGEGPFAAAWAEGCGLTWEQAVSYGMEV